MLSVPLFLTSRPTSCKLSPLFAIAAAAGHLVWWYSWGVCSWWNSREGVWIWLLLWSSYTLVAIMGHVHILAVNACRPMVVGSCVCVCVCVHVTLTFPGPVLALSWLSGWTLPAHCHCIASLHVVPVEMLCVLVNHSMRRAFLCDCHMTLQWYHSISFLLTYLPLS